MMFHLLWCPSSKQSICGCRHVDWEYATPARFTLEEKSVTCGGCLRVLASIAPRVLEARKQELVEGSRELRDRPMSRGYPQPEVPW